MATVYRNGRAYSYRSVRRGGRVTSEYRGSGDAALFMELLDTADRDELEAQEYDEGVERERLGNLDEALDTLNQQTRDAAREALERAGFHRHHRGEWRRRRER